MMSALSRVTLHLPSLLPPSSCLTHPSYLSTMRAAQRHLHSCRQSLSVSTTTTTITKSSLIKLISTSWHTNRPDLRSVWKIVKEKPPGCYLIGFTMPTLFSGINRRSPVKTMPSGSLSPDVLKNIPKEVFKPDVFDTHKRSLFLRVVHRMWQFIRFWLRLTRILLTFTPILTLYPLTYLSQTFTAIWWRCLLWAMEVQGPTFIKLGQWASTRRDLFSAGFCDLFSRLHDDNRTHPWWYTKRKMKKAFGKHWKKLFVQLDKEPIGSGCIAQVHKGYMAQDMIPDMSVIAEMLDDSGNDRLDVDFAEGLEILGFKRSSYDDTDGDTDDVTTTAPPPPDDPNLIPVVVKVLHPSVYTCVIRDLSILTSLCRVAEFILPKLRWISLHESMQEFADLMEKQIDLRFEATCLEQFIDNFENVPSVRFPKPIRPYCKHDVLVETFEEGEPIANFLREDQDYPVELKEEIARSGIEALLQMVFIDNLVHGDLHPGNILVQNAASYCSPKSDNRLMLVDVGDTMVVDVRRSPNPLRLVMLDVGITCSLAHDDLVNLKNVFTAVVLRQGERVAELMLHHARYSDCHDIAAFTRELSKVVEEASQHAVSLEKVNVGRLLLDVFSVCSRHRVKMESNFASILIAILVLEGLGRSLDPKVDILEQAKPILLSTAVSS